MLKPKVALAKYIGEYVDPTLPNGNVNEVKNLPVVAPPYLRTHKHILESIKKAIKEVAETVVHNLICEYGIANVKDKNKVTCKIGRSKRSVFGACPKTFVDKVQKVMTASTLDSSFIRRVVQFGKHGYIIILYSNEIISMIQNVCCNQPVPTVIGAEKTYNLQKLFNNSFF